MFKSIVKRLKKVLNARPDKEVLRENLKKNFIPKEESSKIGEDIISHKQQSMKDSQGISDFSGSGYNGPGNVDHSKKTSNKPHHDFLRD